MPAVAEHPTTVDPVAESARAGSLAVAPRTTVLVTLAALLLTALLNCDQLVGLAQRLPYGAERTAALHLADANHAVSHALWLDQPRHALDRLFGHSPSASAGAPEGSFGPAPRNPVLPAPLPVLPTSPAPSAAKPPPRPTAAHPLRVYLAGDSVGEDVAMAFEQLARQSKVVDFHDDARISTGLTRPDIFDWHVRLRDVVTAHAPPQAVFLTFGANDVQPIMTSHGPAWLGTKAWLAEYRRRAGILMTLLTGSGAHVYWLGQPLMRPDDINRTVNAIDDAVAAEAADHPGVTFVDTRPLLADNHGHYAAYLRGSDGVPTQVRMSDGVHLTFAGGTRVADVLWNLLRERWKLPRH